MNLASICTHPIKVDTSLLPFPHCLRIATLFLFHAWIALLRLCYTDHAQSHALQKLPPPSLCPFRPSKSQHIEVHQGDKGRSVNVWKHLIQADDAGITSRERRDGVCKDLAAGDVGLIV